MGPACLKQNSMYSAVALCLQTSVHNNIEITASSGQKGDEDQNQFCPTMATAHLSPPRARPQ